MRFRIKENLKITLSRFSHNLRPNFRRGIAPYNIHSLEGAFQLALDLVQPQKFHVPKRVASYIGNMFFLPKYSKSICCRHFSQE